MNKNVLIVSDDPLMIFSLSKTMETYGPHITVALTDKEALLQIGSRNYSLAFVDLDYIDSDVTVFLQQITALSPEMKLVVISTFFQNDNIALEVERKAYMFLCKPFDLIQVKLIARQLLGDPVQPVIPARTSLSDNAGNHK